ncbi:MAG: uridine diphosphate-N-acetylglucosamine-binding protein YvcK [Actinomycetota bacterium]
MKVVAVGGGHGAAVTLRAAKLYADEVAAVVTVADDGGSSGRLSRELGILPMGDIRNCIAALAPPSEMVDLFQHRFPDGELAGHVVGNLIITAITQMRGFTDAITEVSRMLGSTGTVVPPTLDLVTLVSTIDGHEVVGQVAAANADGRIERVSLEPENPLANGAAVDLLIDADQIVLGPGSLFTSVIPPLLVPDIAQAFKDSKAVKVYVCNLTAPPRWGIGETAGFDACAHLEALYGHIRGATVDVVVADRGGPGMVSVDVAQLEGMGVKVVVADLMPLPHTPRHDPVRLAKVLQDL